MADYSRKPPRNKLRDLLSDPDRGVGKTSGITGVLSKLFRKMLFTNDVDIHYWRHLMESYIRAESSNHMNLRDRASIRGNLTKEFLNPRMTWKVFCRAMMFLKIRKFKIIIIAEGENGRITEEYTIVEYKTRDEDPDRMMAAEAAARREQKLVDALTQDGEAQEQKEERSSV